MALPQRLSRPIQDPLFPVSPSSDRDMIAKFPTHLWTLIWSCTVQSRLCGGTTGLDYKFAPKANRRPSQSRESLKSAKEHKFTKRETIDYGETFGGLRASVEFLAR
jgi:hypothetical protein